MAVYVHNVCLSMADEHNSPTPPAIELSGYRAIRLSHSRSFSVKLEYENQQKEPYILKDRHYSLLVPWFMDGALAFMQTAVPLLALRFGASAILLGTIGWVAQAMRLPVCFTSGRLSEKVGRTKVIVPAALIFVCVCILFSFARSTNQIIILYAVAMAAIGGFYPPLQALVGDMSQRGQLTKNLGSFNIGWCVGGAVAAVAARWVIGASLVFAFYAAAVGGVIAAVFVLLWRRASNSREPVEQEEAAAVPAENSGPLLIIARMGHFTGFFGYAAIRILFPKVGVSALHWSESRVAAVISLVLVGQAIGILGTNISPWWRGKLWPQLAAQFGMLMCALVIVFSASPLVLGTAFFGYGVAMTVAYTAALYHGLSGRKDRGRNTGIHESLVAAGNIAGCLIGGLVADKISLAAPYVVVACLAGLCLITTGVLWRRYMVQSRQGVSEAV